MRTLLVALPVLVFGLVSGTGTVSAQYAQPPGQYPQPQSQPQPQPQPQPYYPQPQPSPQPSPQPYYQQPYYQPAPQPMRVQLTVDEQWLLSRGYISDGEHIGGGIASLFFGFGVGQAVQGRWSQKGYIFTVGEIASFGAVIWGITDLFSCDDSLVTEDPTCDHARERRGGTLIVGGVLAMSVFRIWEIVDAFAGPSEHNRQLHDLHMRLGIRDSYVQHVKPYVAPTGDGGGALAGVAMRF